MTCTVSGLVRTFTAAIRTSFGSIRTYQSHKTGISGGTGFSCKLKVQDVQTCGDWVRPGPSQLCMRCMRRPSTSYHSLISFLSHVPSSTAHSHTQPISQACVLCSCILALHDDSSKFRTTHVRVAGLLLQCGAQGRAGWHWPTSYFLFPLRMPDGVTPLCRARTPHTVASPCLFNHFRIHFLFQNVDHENSLSHIPSIKSRVSDQHGHARACAQSARA